MGSIHGLVVDADMPDTGIPGASVFVVGTDRVVTTDATGAFTFADLPPGDVVLKVTAPDYDSATLSLAESQRGLPVRIVLQYSGADQLQITVAGRRPPPETASTHQVTGRALTAAPRRNAEELLRQVPGLTLVQHGSEGKGHQFFMRGFDAIHGADLEITLDGVPLNEWSNIHAQGYLDLGLIIPEMVDLVRVTKGPFTLGQGAFAMAGSADYLLGVADADLGWRVAYTAGTTNRHRLFAGYSPADGDGQDFIGIEATHDDGFGQNRQLNRVTANGRVRLFEGDTGSLALTLLGGYSAFELPGTLRNEDVQAGRVDFYGTYDSASIGDSGRGVISLDYDWHDGEHEVRITTYGGYRHLDLLENFTGFLIDPDNGDRREQSQSTWSFGVVGAHRSQLVDTLALRSGLGVRGDVFSQTEDTVGQDLQPLSARRDFEARQVIVHALAGLRWEPLDSLSIDAGVRLDAIIADVTDCLAADGDGGDTLVVASPRFTLRFAPGAGWALFAAYGRGYRPPEARAFSEFDVGRQGLGDEVQSALSPTATVSDAIEAGIRFSPGEWLGITLSGFATFIERESIFDHVSGVSVELNGTRRLGGELIIESTPVPWLNLSADLTLVDARFVESGTDVPYAPWLTAGVRAVVTHESGFRAGLRVLTVAPRRLPHGATGATLIMTDVTLGFHWRWLRFDVEIENVVNQALREGEYHYASHWRPGESASQIPTLHTTAGPPINARFTLGAVF